MMLQLATILMKHIKSGYVLDAVMASTSIFRTSSMCRVFSSWLMSVVMDCVSFSLPADSYRIMNSIFYSGLILMYWLSAM